MIVGRKDEGRSTRGLGLGLALILNLVPVLGVLMWGWSAFSLILLYWLENLAIGARNVVSMAAAAWTQGRLPQLAFLAPFFTIHYGLFCLGHGVFIVTLFGRSALRANGPSPFALGEAVRAAFAGAPQLWIGLASILLWQAGVLILFLLRGEARTTRLSALMGAPYPRILVLHLTIILSGMLVLGMGEPRVGVAAMAAVKSGLDVFLFLRHERARGGDHALRFRPQT